MVYDFGYRLKKLRKNKRMTQEGAATRLGVSKTTISGYENNVKNPSLETLTKLASLYGVSTDYILGLEKRKMVAIDGLSASQEEIIRRLIMEFRSEQKKEGL